MTVALSKRGEVEPFHAMDVLAKANRLRAKGLDVVSMAVGQPSDPAPVAVREAASRALVMVRCLSHDRLLFTLQQRAPRRNQARWRSPTRSAHI